MLYVLTKVFLFKMTEQFLEYHKERPIMVDLPVSREDNKIPVYLTNKNVLDDYSNEYYFVVDVKERNKFDELTNKIIEHYIYKHFKQYLKLFSIDGEIYIKFNFI